MCIREAAQLRISTPPYSAAKFLTRDEGEANVAALPYLCCGGLIVGELADLSARQNPSGEIGSLDAALQ